ncbi:hypothetical protein F4776DRAFT_667028 [Hypoxylon sp. NC0597]|nr:hypothetical protein F4776DRAFT_667028 [Hypoxylon sp. NC0597]
MAAQGNFVGGLLQLVDQNGDTVMTDAVDEDTVEGIVSLNGWNIVHKFYVHRQEESFSLRLVGIHTNDQTNSQSPLLLPLISTRPVAASYSNNLLNTNTLLLKSSQQNRTAIQKAWGYLLARKNSLYLQVRGDHGNKLGVDGKTHSLAPYEEYAHILTTAKAVVIQPQSQSLGAWTLDEGLPKSLCCLLLILRRNNRGEVEFYNPVNDTICTLPDENDIVLLECEEAISLMYHWDQVLREPMPSSPALKRKTPDWKREQDVPKRPALKKRKISYTSSLCLATTYADPKDH